MKISQTALLHAKVKVERRSKNTTQKVLVIKKIPIKYILLHITVQNNDVLLAQLYCFCLGGFWRVRQESYKKKKRLFANNFLTAEAKT